MTATTAPGSMRGARLAAAIAFAAIVVGVGGIAVAGAVAPARLALSDAGPVTCPFRLLTHVRCPLCGMTRATAHLARGDVAGALHLHPLAPLVLVVLVGGVLVWLGAVARARPVPAWLRPRAWSLALFGAVVWAANLLYGHG